MDLGLLYEFDVPQTWEGKHPWGGFVRPLWQG